MANKIIIKHSTHARFDRDIDAIIVMKTTDDKKYFLNKVGEWIDCESVEQAPTNCVYDLLSQKWFDELGIGE